MPMEAKTTSVTMLLPHELGALIESLRVLIKLRVGEGHGGRPRVHDAGGYNRGGE